VGRLIKSWEWRKIAAGLVEKPIRTECGKTGISARIDGSQIQQSLKKFTGVNGLFTTFRELWTLHVVFRISRSVLSQQRHARFGQLWVR
jgi:hypothetical protein